MLVADLAEDLASALAQFPQAADWRLGVACHEDGAGGDIAVMWVGGWHVDADDEFFLVPEGLGPAFGMADAQPTAHELQQALAASPDWAAMPTFVHAEILHQPDGSAAVRNEGLWGVGVHEEARLVYFYFGAGGA